MAEPAENGSGGGRNLFRAETAVTNFDLRLDVAARMVRMSESENMEVDRREVKVFGGLSFQRGLREIVVEGNYRRNTHEVEMTSIKHGFIKDVVHGPTSEIFAMESESIMAGGYVSLNAGGCAKVLAVADQLCWGGWIEADGLRVFVSKIEFHSYFGVGHTAGARFTYGKNYIDDFLMRAEYFGNLQDLQSNTKWAGTPDSGTVMET